MEIDLEEGWDLDREEDRQQAMAYVDMEKPTLLTGSPPCEAFSSLRWIGMSKRDPEEVKRQREKAEERLHTACSFYRRQYDEGRLFLHEHPDKADSWHDAEIVELSQRPGVFRVRGPMCRWGLQLDDCKGDFVGEKGYVRKMTGWLTNNETLAKLLDTTCSNELGKEEWHRHVHLIGGGLARASQKYRLP